MSKRYGLFAALVLVVCAAAQENRPATVNGKLQGANLQDLHGYLIELEQFGKHGNTIRADVEPDGDFVFRNIPAGDYMLRVTNYHGQSISQQFVSIQDRTSSLDVRLPAEAPSPTGTTVSFRELRHPPSRKALNASVAAQRFADSGNYDRAAGELEKAVRISPDFAPAHSNLAVQYLRMQRYEEAKAEIERAIAIAGPNARDLSNLAFADMALLRVAEAADAAKAALKLEPGNAAAHYMLGSVLCVNRQTRGEGIAHLEVAAKTLESARKALARFAGHAD